MNMPVIYEITAIEAVTVNAAIRLALELTPDIFTVWERITLRELSQRIGGRP
jgi:hypothetical protein